MITERYFQPYKLVYKIYFSMIDQLSKAKLFSVQKYCRVNSWTDETNFSTNFLMNLYDLHS